MPLESSLTPIQLDLESRAEKEMCWKYLILATNAKAVAEKRGRVVPLDLRSSSFRNQEFYVVGVIVEH